MASRNSKHRYNSHINANIACTTPWDTPSTWFQIGVGPSIAHWATTAASTENLLWFSASTLRNKFFP